MSIFSISGYSYNNPYTSPLYGYRNNSSSSYHNISPVRQGYGSCCRTSSYAGTERFVRAYQKSLTNLKSAVSKLRDSSGNTVFTDYEAGSSDPTVADVKGKYRLKPETDIDLYVQSIAKAQKNVSASHGAQEEVGNGADMEFDIASATGNKRVSVSSLNDDGTKKTYEQMYMEAAQTINADSSLGVKASITNVYGRVSLELTAKDTGASKGFAVTGDMGAADGLNTAAVNAQDAVYTVTQDGYTQTHQSETNTISLDYGRMEAELKREGSTNIYTTVDTDKITSAVEDLVDKYNTVTKLLEENAYRGIGAADRLSSFKRGMADEKTLKALGITFNTDGEMELDKDKLATALQDDYDYTKSLIAGQFGIAEKADYRAQSALSDPVQRIVSNNLAPTSIFSVVYADNSHRRFQTGPYDYGNHIIGLFLNTRA